MTSPTCQKCDCVKGCQSNPVPCPNLLAECIASGQVSAAEIEQHRLLERACRAAKGQAMIKRNTRCWQCNKSYNMRSLVCPNCEAANANQDLTQANAESIDQETVYEKSARWTWPDGRPEL